MQRVSIFKARGKRIQVNWKMIKYLLYPIRWTADKKNPDRFVKQYYHLYSMEAITLRDVYQYVAFRCEYSGLFFPEWTDQKFNVVANGIKQLILREDIPEGQQLIYNNEPFQPSPHKWYPNC
jgi:hypothetical protein